VTGPEGLFERGRRVIPGGVNSPVRAFGAVGGTPVFAVRGEGAYLHDTDGRAFVDLVQSWGALLFGHARPEIVAAASEAAARGTSFGAPTEAEVLMAERLTAMVPSVERVRLVSSGTEAAMSAVRLARAATGRPKIVKFDGCYHGHSDALLARSGSGMSTFGIPGTPGVTAGASADTIVLPWGDAGTVEELFHEGGHAVACVILEPVPANIGVLAPPEGFLATLRDLTADAGALLVFDEVITGFRLAPGGAQERLGVPPDLTVLGKVMGGGFPCAAFGGRADVMDHLAPGGPVYQAGTLSGNPVAVAAGLAALDLVERLDPFTGLDRSAETLIAGLSAALTDAGVRHTINRVGSLFSVFFAEIPVADAATARAADHGAYARFFHAMLERGVYLPPSGYEAWFLSTAHGDEELDRVVQAAREAAKEVAATAGS
jgi:glutamate-1-semialdehyde 2,1-aminomutase